MIKPPGPYHMILCMDSQPHYAPHIDNGSSRFFDISLCDRHAADIVILGNFIHDIQHIFLQDRPQSSGSCMALHSLFGNGLQSLILKNKLHLIHLKKLLILL